MRLIDADAFIEKLAHVPMVQEAIKKAMDTMPTVDAVPVVHGRWQDEGDLWLCTACGKGYVTEAGVTPIDAGMHYCPNCGARMDAERKEERIMTEKEEVRPYDPIWDMYLDEFEDDKDVSTSAERKEE